MLEGKIPLLFGTSKEKSPFLRHGFDKGNSTREVARCGAHPLQAFFVDSISTQEAQSSHLRGAELVIYAGQRTPVHGRPTPASSGLALDSLALETLMPPQRREQ